MSASSRAPHGCSRRSAADHARHVLLLPLGPGASPPQESRMSKGPMTRTRFMGAPRGRRQKFQEPRHRGIQSEGASATSCVAVPTTMEVRTKELVHRQLSP